MTLIIGMDPGVHTGVATYVAGELTDLETVPPHHIERIIRGRLPACVVFEDSRLQSHTWTRGRSGATSAKMARNVGQVDAWCRLIEEVCAELGIQAHGISPAGKGAKIDAKAFGRVTGWTGASNEHARDAAMVAWPYRRVDSPSRGKR
ncbi:hypothetical protein [Acidovorax sp. NCPPB 4044]|uniref:hypothetical protein n=1 Tax=Acidovorax sp. NCPPB 4044 TaxID=2940490 RepID=UPI002303F3B7|nr:hypothetical protein [Acidovorax sp. NCPPB 4044]MDA8521999.1 hypothetical protein [Acidovorax sp. NCPPB 4044]